MPLPLDATLVAHQDGAVKYAEVARTDATPAFVKMMRAAGHDARLLDVRSDPLGGPCQGVLANAVLLHLSRAQFQNAVQRARSGPCCR